MGSYLSSAASGNELKTSFPLINFSLAKIRELHGGFKSVCDNFAINLTEFESIFQSNQQTFNVFDTDHNGLIDALEIFSGLIIFSDSKAEDKIRFLFDLFDFNEIQSISLMDLEFLLSSVLTSTSKIFGLNIEVQSSELLALVRKSFAEGQRITIQQLLIWCCKTDEINQYFIKFRLEGPEIISQKVLQDAEFILYDKYTAEGEGLNYQFPSSLGQTEMKQNFLAKSASQLVNNKRSQNFRVWLHTALQPLIAYRLESVSMNNYLKVPDEIKVKLEWVYGIRCQDTKKCMMYTIGRQDAEATGTRNKYEKQLKEFNQEIIYFVSNIVILLNPNLNQQRFYTQHAQEIISMAICNLNGDLVATGELSAIRPSIHVWNCRTLQNIQVLSGVHQKGIHLLQFSSDDRFLMTCGLQNPSAVLIYDWYTGVVIISASIQSPTQDVVTLRGKDPWSPSYNGPNVEEQELMLNKHEQKPIEGFVLISLDCLIVFAYDSKLNEFVQTFLQMEQIYEVCQALPLCAMSILVDYKNQFFKQGNAQDIVQEEGEPMLDGDHALKHLVLTGHADGKILIWTLQKFIVVLDDYGVQITAMSKCFEGIAFCTISGQIHIWDQYLYNNTKTIDINQMPFKVLSSYICNIDYNQRKILITTVNGDVIEANINDAVNQKTVKAIRLNTVVRIAARTNKALTILSTNEQTIMIGGDNGIISSFDVATHELVDIWAVGQPITSIACLTLEEGGFVVAAGTEEGKIILRQDWEELMPRQHICGQKPIIDVKFSKNGQLIAAASLDKNVYLMKYHENNYVALAACKIDNGFPVSLNFSEDSSKIVINTNQRKLLVLDPNSFMLQYKPEDLSQVFWSSWISKFPLITKSLNSTMMPIVLGNLSNLVVAGDENGNVYLWKDVESIKENIGNNFSCHTTNVQKLELTIDDKRILSMGFQDQSICQYKIKPIIYTEGQINLKRGVDDVSQSYGVQKIVLNPDLDECLILELNYCFQILSRKTDQIQDQTVLIRGSNNSSVNRILCKANFDNEEKVWLRPPSISLILENIYGVLLSDKRHTIMYIHFYNKADQDTADRLRLKHTIAASKSLNLGETAEKKLDYILPRILGSDYQNLLRQQQAIEYDYIHATCYKNLVYYSSRIGVVYDANKKTQSFYQGHKLKISAIARHPYLRIVATGEVNINPQIHVWDAQTTENLVILDTAHKGGVLHLIFSTDGQKIVSIGMDRTFSIQVFIWKQGRTLAFRNTGYYPIFGIKFNPYDDSIFLTCGYQHLAEWKIEGSHLTCIKYVNVYDTKGKNNDDARQKGKPVELDQMQNQLIGQKNILLCLDFISFRLGHSIQSDVVFGNNLGDISTYCSSKYFVLNEQAHPGAPINCIKVTNSLSLDQKTVMVVTAGEDGMIKIWDASIILKQQVDLKQAVSIQDLKNIKSYGIQSLDIFPCDRQNPQSTALVRVLCGMRSGDVIECLVDFNRNYTTNEDILADKLLSEEQKLIEIQKLKFQNEFQSKYNIKFSPVFSGHSSLQLSHKQKKIITCLYPLYGVLASVGNDETLMFWDINKASCIISKNLGTQATCLDFSPDGRYLAVGLVNGVFLILESYIERLNFGTYMEEFSLPTLKVVMCPKEAKSSIITIKFSYKGDFLAISYNNEYKLHDLLEEAEVQDDDNPLSKMNIQKKKQENQFQDVKRDPSFALIYVNKKSDKNVAVVQSIDPYIKMQRIMIPLQEFQSSAVIRAKLAITKFDFSDDDKYLEMCSQLVDKDNNIQLDSNEDIFVVWDITMKRLVNDYDKLRFTAWPDWSLSSSLNARYVNKGYNRDTDDEEKRKFLLEQCMMTNVSRFNLLDNAIAGSMFGEIFAFRFGAIYIDKNRVPDFKYDRVVKRDMAISKAFDALTSVIQSINIFEDKKVFVTGNDDQCILQYRVEYEDQDWELDFNTFLPEIPDPFGEIPPYNEFSSLITEIWKQRLELAEIQQNIDQDEYSNPTCELELQHIIGRRAFDRRNNVKIDCQDRILYCASSLMIFLQDNLDPDENTFIQQTFMRPQNEKYTSTSPEVSCFVLSEDRRLLFIGTNHIESNLIVWEISTNLQLAKIVLPQISIISTLQIAYDNKHVLLIGVTPEYVLTIILMDFTTQNIICQKLFLHSLPYKIKDAKFIPGYTRRFITCGIQHMCFWKFNGQSLEYTVAEIAIPRAFSNLGQSVYSSDKNKIGKFGLTLVCQESEMINTVLKNQKQNLGMNELDEELENIYVTFLCCCFISDTLITAGDDGQLYIWEHQRIVRRVFAHEGAVLALEVNQKLGFIASGGMEGIVILWRLLSEARSNVKSLDKLKVFNLRKNMDAQQAVMSPEYNVQSICLGYNRVVVGMRSGTILEMQISDDGTSVIRHNYDKKSKIRKWMRCIDNESPISIAVDMVSEKIFSMTAAGLFTAWDLVSFDVVYSKDFHKVAQNIIAFKLSNKVLLVFDNDIIVLGSNIHNGYDELKEYELKLNKISDAKLNSTERLLGIASTSSSTPEVSLYETEDGFSKLTTFYGFKSSIKYIDFSTDNFYLQCEDNLGEVQLFEIESSRLINMETIDFELEWLSEGLRSYAPLENIRRQYTSDNKIMQIVKISGKPIIAIGDEIGTIRFFNYPNRGNDQYYQCYSDHLYNITKCLFTHDQRYFVSTSIYDRCIYKFKVTYNDKKCLELQELRLNN